MLNVSQPKVNQIINLPLSSQNENPENPTARIGGSTYFQWHVIRNMAINRADLEILKAQDDAENRPHIFIDALNKNNVIFICVCIEYLKNGTFCKYRKSLDINQNITFL